MPHKDRTKTNSTTTRQRQKKRRKAEQNWVKSISPRPLDETESQFLKRFVIPKQIPTEAIVPSVEAALCRNRNLSAATKDNIRSRVASTLQTTSITDNNLTKDENQALKRLKYDENIVILPADKGRVTVVMEKENYHDKMSELVNDKQTYQELKRDPTPAIQRKVNNKLLILNKLNAIDTRRLLSTTDDALYHRDQNCTNRTHRCDP